MIPKRRRVEAPALPGFIVEPAPLPGLSVWMWGPTMWTLLQTLALQCDTVHEKAFSAEEVDTFFKHVQPLLPCRYCSSSYGGFLQEVSADRKESVAEAFRSRHMVSFVFELHNKVNQKLAKQRWSEMVGVLKSKLSEQSCRELLTCEGLDTQMASLLDKTPSISTVHKRNEVFRHEPLNLEALLILLIALANRAPLNNTEWNFILLLSTTCKVLENVDSDRFKASARALQDPLTSFRKEVSTGSNAEGISGLYTCLFDIAKPSVSFPEFRAQAEARVQLLRASWCGAGTCK